jgi:hypothetical protein
MQCLVSIGVQSFAIMLTSLFNSGNHNVLDMGIGALCPISEAMISAKDMHAFQTCMALSTPMVATNERFSYF